VFWDIPVVCEPARGYPICLPLGAGTSHIAIHCVLGCHIAVAQTTGTSHLPHMGCPIQLFWDIPSSYSGTSHPANLGHPNHLHHGDGMSHLSFIACWDVPSCSHGMSHVPLLECWDIPSFSIMYWDVPVICDTEMGHPIHRAWDIPVICDTEVGHPIHQAWDIPLTCCVLVGCPIK
jgi:hypothetical protein